MRDYIVWFKKETIVVVLLNQEMFMGEFHNSLEVRHFNESLTQKPTLSLAEVVTMAECNIK